MRADTSREAATEGSDKGDSDRIIFHLSFVNAKERFLSR
jgi:hypothetical protein